MKINLFVKIINKYSFKKKIKLFLIIIKLKISFFLLIKFIKKKKDINLINKLFLKIKFRLWYSLIKNLLKYRNKIIIPLIIIKKIIKENQDE